VRTATVRQICMGMAITIPSAPQKKLTNMFMHSYV
jgi:hypothetical protein